jgi:hypothetical protein
MEVVLFSPRADFEQTITSYKGQLLELNFTTNLTTDPALKDEIDKIVESVQLEE